MVNTNSEIIPKDFQGSTNNAIIGVKLSAIHLLIVFIFCLSSFYFYEPIFLNEQLLKLLYWFMVIVLFGFSLKPILYNSETFKFISPLRVLVISMFVSVLSAMVFWGQSPHLTIRAMFPYLGFVLYFYLLTTKPPLVWLVRLIWILAALYILIYLFSLIQIPNTVFGSFMDRTVSDKRGFFRLFIPGRGFMFLSFFMSVSSYLYSKRTRWLWIAFGLFLIIVAHVIRQYILFSFIIAGVVLLWRVELWKKILLLLLCVIAGYYVYEYSSIIQALINITNAQIVENKPVEDVRITAYRYFFFEFAPNLFASIFGNGVPHDQSSYGSFYRFVVNDQMELFMSDVGFAQIYAQFGLFGLLSVFFIFFRSFYIKVPSKYLYLKLFIIFVFFSNFLSGYFLSNHNIAAISIVLYMMEVVSKNDRQSSDVLTQ
jgi:hypothetical protein